MSPRVFVSPIYRKLSKKRKGMYCLKKAMKVTDCLIKKFQELRITDLDDSSLPQKRMKLSEDLMDNDLETDEAMDCLLLDLSLSVIGEESIQDVPMSESPSLVIISSPIKTSSRELNNNKKSTKVKSRLKNTKKDLIFEEFQPDSSYDHVVGLFQRCVNFVRPRGVQNICDIGEIAQNFSTFGKVLSIQDHWVQPKESLHRYSSLWTGAMVTYKNKEDADRALKALCARNTFMIGVSLFNHLSRLKESEKIWVSQNYHTNNKGTSIIVNGIISYSDKFHFDFALYGTVLGERWYKGDKSKYSCEVTYSSTVSAVAAALALDGKTVRRSLLKTKIKITPKELDLHRMLCNTF